MKLFTVILIVFGVIMVIGVIICIVAIYEYYKFNRTIKNAVKKDLENQVKDIYEKEMPEQMN